MQYTGADIELKATKMHTRATQHNTTPKYATMQFMNKTLTQFNVP